MTNWSQIPKARTDLAKVAYTGKYGDLIGLPDISLKADKVVDAVTGDFAGLDSDGNLTDSGYDASDFATAAQGALASTAVQDVTLDGISMVSDSIAEINTLTNADLNTLWNSV